MTYRFVGLKCDLGDGTVLERYGESVDLSEEEANEHIRQNAALLPEEAFSALGHTPAELDQHFSVALHGNAPAEFLTKRNSAWKALHEHRESLKAAAKAAQEGK